MIPVTLCLNDLNGKGNYEEVDLSEDTLKKILVDFDMYIVQPIIINEEFEIIEGQCRFQQLKQLNKNYATVQQASSKI